MLENKFGYLLLSVGRPGYDNSPLLVKASKVYAIRDWDFGVRIYVDDNVFEVVDSMDEILEQLENIHPSML
jgi:hypothetical protein